jgi:hypothetical protein
MTTGWTAKVQHPPDSMRGDGQRRRRLWEWRPYGKQRALPTGTWKSRREREIPTFPQPIIFVYQEEEDREDHEHEERRQRPVVTSTGRRRVVSSATWDRQE